MSCFPLVSVIIPFYDHADWLCEAVDSVLNQTYNNLEIIVINDGSEEDMTVFLEKYNDKVIYIFKENGGPATARNLGIEMATGEYIALLDSDDLWNPIKLEKQLEFMLSNHFVWSHTAYKTFGQGESELHEINDFHGCVYPYILISSSIATPCVMIKNKILKNDNSLRFNEKMRYGQDYYLWIMLAQKYPLGAINEVLSKVRIRGTNASKRAYVQINVRNAIWNEISINDKDIPKSIRFAYQSCSIGTRILNKLKNITNMQLIEWLSKIIYAFPYIVFRLYRK